VNLALSYPFIPKSINYDLNPLLAGAHQEQDKEGDYQENHIRIHLASNRNITLI